MVVKMFTNTSAIFRTGNISLEINTFRTVNKILHYSIINRCSQNLCQPLTPSGLLQSVLFSYFLRCLELLRTARI
jgi:hypothetical protein